MRFNIDQEVNFGLRARSLIPLARPFEEQRVCFPHPCDVDITMMPFILADSFKKSKLPQKLQGYWKMIKMCGAFDSKQIDKVCYLTVQENWVGRGKCQRREGVFTERPGRVELAHEQEQKSYKKGHGQVKIAKYVEKHYSKMYGGFETGSTEHERLIIRGGIFMACSENNSCRIWNCEVTDNSIIRNDGDISHLQNFFPDSYEDMNARNMYWLSDRTPIQHFPLKKRAYCQYFCLVTSQVSLWFEDHYSKNPLGVTPDNRVTMIVKGNKSMQEKPNIATQIRESLEIDCYYMYIPSSNLVILAFPS